ncbi:MAG: exosortase/archaeosortase family protein [Tepidisphaeraceae bacterium]|jgi:exosortase
MSDPQTNDSSGHGGGDTAPVAVDSERPLLWGIAQTAWIEIAVVAALFVCLFWPNLRRLWDKTNPFNGEANWGHAIGVPIIGLYYLYVNREKLLNPGPAPAMTARAAALRVWGMLLLALLLPLVLLREVARNVFHPAAVAVAALAVATLAYILWQSNGPLLQKAREHSAGWFGGFIVVFGIALYGYGIYPGQNDFVKDFGMVVTLFGVVLALSGWGVMRTAWFPVLFLVCAIPWPALMYSRIAGPLQQLAARVAVRALQLTGVEASAGGTKIFIAGHGGVTRTLNVAEACAGLRSLMTFISVGAAVAFLSHRPFWQKTLVTLSAIPIAIFCNVMRVSGQGLLDHYVSQQLSENFAHQFVGMIMLIPAFLLILLVGWILDQIFLEEAGGRRGGLRMIRRAAAPAPVAVAPLRSTLRGAALAARNVAPGGPRPLAAVPKAPIPKAAATPKPATAPRSGTMHPKPGTGAKPSRASTAWGQGVAFPPPPPVMHLAPRLYKAPAAKPLHPRAAGVDDAADPAVQPPAKPASAPAPANPKREAV